MKILSYDDDIKNEACFTPWSLIHFLVGVVTAILFIYINVSFYHGFIIYFIIHGVYEIKDYILANYSVKLNKHIDNSFINSIYDQLISMAGFTLVYWLKLYNIGQEYYKNTMIMFLVIFLLYIYLSIGPYFVWG